MDSHKSLADLRKLLVVSSVTSVLLIGCTDQGFLLRRDPDLKKGTSVYTTSESFVDDGNTTLRTHGETFAGSYSVESREVSETEQLGGHKVRFIQHVDFNKTLASIRGEKIEHSKENPLLNIPVIGYKEDGRWQYVLEKGSPTREQLQELKVLGASHSESLMYPSYRVKLGDRWTFDPAVIMGNFEDFVDGTGEGSAEFRAITVHDELRCAQIVGTIKFAGRLLEGDDEASIEAAGSIEILRSLDLAIDLSTNFTGEITMSFDITSDGTRGKMVVSGPWRYSNHSVVN